MSRGSVETNRAEETIPAVEVESLRFAYGPASDGEDPFELHVDRWCVRKGERFALHGPSGCGKSTLLDLVAGVLLPAVGRLKVGGIDLAALPETERRAFRLRQMGFVFQDFPLVGYLDALDNVLLPFRLHRELHAGLGRNGPARERAAQLLRELGLGSELGRRPEQLSQGERQRVAIARALVTEPALLLADEPTAGLDPERAASVLDLLERLSDERGLTLLLVTHDPGILDRFERRLDVGRLSAREPSEPVP